MCIGRESNPGRPRGRRASTTEPPMLAYAKLRILRADVNRFTLTPRLNVVYSPVYKLDRCCYDNQLVCDICSIYCFVSRFTCILVAVYPNENVQLP